MVFQKGNADYKLRKNYKPNVSKFCKTCGKHITVFACLTEIKNFCSRKCYGSFLKLRPKEDHPSWKGGAKQTYRGYVYIPFGKLESNGKPNQLEHRVVMEKILGRKLTSNEHVHHINKIKTDNRPENLLLTTPQTHRQYHRLETWAKKYDRCIVCKTTSTKHHSLGRCVRCRSAARYKASLKLK